MKRWHRHSLVPLGGIPFAGKRNIWSNGYQMLYCRHCMHREPHWPWGDRTFDADETFGYWIADPVRRLKHDYVWGDLPLPEFEDAIGSALNA